MFFPKREMLTETDEAPSLWTERPMVSSLLLYNVVIDYINVDNRFDAATVGHLNFPHTCLSIIFAFIPTHVMLISAFTEQLSVTVSLPSTTPKRLPQP